MRSLKTQWVFLALASGLLIILGGRLLVDILGIFEARNWFIVSFLTLAYQFVSLWRDLPKNISAAKRNLLPGFGPGTWLSLVRLVCIACMAGFLVVRRPSGRLIWAPFIFSLISNFTDLLDGYVARVFDTTSQLGKKLDMDLDGRVMLVSTLLAIHYGRTAWWFLPVGLARYIYVSALWLRKRLGLRIELLAASKARRALAGTQLVFATALLAPFFSPPETFFASAFFMIPFLGHFVYDWLQISGRPKLVNSIKQFLKKPLIRVELPLLFRVLAIGLIAGRVILSADPPLFLAVEFVLGLALTLGLAGRVAAAASLIEIGVRLHGQSALLSDWMLLLACTGLLYLGTGPGSLWRPEDHWIAYRAGEKQKA